jgi:hypothetical protein
MDSINAEWVDQVISSCVPDSLAAGSGLTKKSRAMAAL